MGLNKFLYGKNILCIGAHPDDIEIGCGATLAEISSGCEVRCLILSMNDEHPEIGTTLVDVTKNSLATLGISPNRISFGGFRTRHFQSQRQEIADTLYKVREEFRPDLVFSHSAHDMHQDHLVVYAESVRVFRGNILGFEIIRSTVGFEPNFLVPVKGKSANLKFKVLEQYADVNKATYLRRKVQESHLIVRGSQCDSTYAEGFEAFRVTV